MATGGPVPAGHNGQKRYPPELFQGEFRMFFASDNWAGVAPQILEGVVRAASGTKPAYGDDAHTARAQAMISEVFETECAVYFVTSGSAANALGLATLTPPYGTILCHEASHIHIDECACPEFYTGGAKLQPLAGANGKLTPDILEAYLRMLPGHAPHQAPFSVVSLTQATESGTAYSVAETEAVAETAKKNGLKLHMDGARFANAVISTGAAPADMSWRAGVDVLSFGGTKNGCMAAEAVVLFDPSLAEEFEYRRKRGGHLWSKGRFLGAQFEAYLEGDLWLNLAAQANDMATRLSEGLAAIHGVEIAYPTDINEVFAILPDGLANRLTDAGAVFHPWICPGDVGGGQTVRLVTSFETRPEDVDRFLALAHKFSV